MLVIKDFVMYYVTTYSRETIFAILAVVSVAAIVEAVNQLAFGRGKVDSRKAALIASFSILVAMVAWCLVSGVDLVTGIATCFFAFFPMLLLQYWIAQRILKEPIASLINRFSSGWTKAKKDNANTVKVKKVKVGGIIYYAYKGADGKQILAESDPNVKADVTA